MGKQDEADGHPRVCESMDRRRHDDDLYKEESAHTGGIHVLHFLYCIRVEVQTSQPPCDKMLGDRATSDLKYSMAPRRRMMYQKWDC
jgi:hypothetical protein